MDGEISILAWNFCGTYKGRGFLLELKKCKRYMFESVERKLIFFYFLFSGRILFAPGSASTTGLRSPGDKDDEDNGSPPPNKRDMEKKEENIEFLQITPTTIQVQFPGITGGNLVSWERSIQCCFRYFLRQQHCS